MGESRGTGEGAQLGGDEQEALLAVSAFSAPLRLPGSRVSGPRLLPHHLPLHLVFLPFSPSVPLHPILLLLHPSVSSLPSISSPFPPPQLPTLPHPTMHHSVLVIHLFHLCFLLLLRGGGCDHRNISEGEKGLNWGEADGGAVSSMAGGEEWSSDLVEPGLGAGAGVSGWSWTQFLPPSHHT